MIDHEYNLGDKLKDKVTGFSGIVMGITKYATDCLHYGLQSCELKDQAPIAWQWFDESRIALVLKKAVSFNRGKKPTSGPYPDAPSM